MSEASSQANRWYSIKKWGLAIAGLFILIVGLGYGIERHVESLLKGQIQDLGNSFAGDRYQFRMQNFDFQLLSRKVTATDLAYEPTSSSDDSTHLISSTIDAVNLQGIGLIPFLSGGVISINNISLESPILILRGRVGRNPFAHSNIFPGQSSNPNFPKIQIEHFELSGAKLQLLHPADSSREASVQNLNLQLNGMVIDSTTINRPTLFEFKSGNLQAKNIFSQSPGNFYNFKIASLKASSNDSSLTADSVSLQPRYPKQTFSREYGNETDRVELKIPGLQFNNLDISSLFNNRLHADHLILKHAQMDIYHNKRMPSPPDLQRSLPHIALQNLAMEIDLDTISVESSRISYSEHLPKVAEPGKVTFGNFYASIYHITNDSTQFNRKKAIILDAQMSIMDAAPLNVYVSFPFNTDKHHMKGSLGRMQMKKLNPVLTPLGFVRVTSGTINHMEFNIYLTPKESTGNVLFNYTDCSIELVERHDITEKNKRMLTFLVNTFKIKSSNDSPPLRDGTVSFERDPQRSMFHYWWKSLFSGMKDSIGL